MKAAKSASAAARSSRRIKCACASCNCTVDMDRAFRKGAQVYCSRQCAEVCTKEVCRCEHDHCAM
jgi:hypothetical protein